MGVYYFKYDVYYNIIEINKTHLILRQQSASKMIMYIESLLILSTFCYKMHLTRTFRGIFLSTIILRIVACSCGI